MDLKTQNHRTKVIEGIGSNLILECGKKCFKSSFHNDYVTKFEKTCLNSCIELKSNLILIGNDVLMEHTLGKKK